MTAADTSISGLSSGGYMAVQFHVAFSETLRGAGITAGGMVGCRVTIHALVQLPLISKLSLFYL